MVKPFGGWGSAPDPTRGAYSAIFHNLLSIASTLCRVPTVRESRGILRESGKVRENRGSGKSQGILIKYCSLDQLFMHYFHNFCRLLGALPPDSHRGSPCKHCRLVYIAIFYNGTKFSITFVYLVLFYWRRK